MGPSRGPTTVNGIRLMDSAVAGAWAVMSV